MLQKKISSFLAILWMAFLLTSCATSQNRRQHAQLQKFVKMGQYDQALILAKSKKFYEDEDSKLLKLLETATIHYLQSNYFQALKTFDKAGELSDKLFTQSIKGKLKAALVNSNLDKYYGEKYERSLIRFYQALSHFMLYQTGKYEAYTREIPYDKDGKKLIKLEPIEEKKLSYKERRMHLMGARASILSWDSLLESYRSVTGGEPTYKDDLVAKVFGAFIHEQMNSNSDRMIALNLYKKAKEILTKNYGIYSSFNGKNEKFIKNFGKFSSLGIKKVKKDFFLETAQYKNLVTFLDRRIGALKKGRKDNLFIFSQSGFISPKVANKFHFPIPTALFLGKINAKKGKSFPQFVASVLGASHGTAPSITYELPMIKKDPSFKHYSIVVMDMKGTIIKESEMGLIEPLSELAYETLAYKQSATNSKIGARLAAKHITALYAAYLLYKKSGMFAATIAYAISNKAIAASEQADLRYWSTIPKSISVTSLRLPKGEYKLAIRYSNADKKSSQLVHWSKPVKIGAKPKMVDMRINQ